MTEDQDLLAKIGQLAGQINRHKTQTSDSLPTQYPPRHPPPRQHQFGWAPYRGRGHARHPAAPHRHRTLILNNATPASATSSTSSLGPASDTDAETRSAPSSGWVAKRDRHMQLINSAIYDKETQARTKAIEESRKLKAQRRAKVEEGKVLQYAQGAGRAPPTVVAAGQHHPASAQPTTGYQVLVNDVPFGIARGGSKLIRISSRTPSRLTSVPGSGSPVTDDPLTANATPKKVTVAGVTFVRSKKGNLHRLGAVTSKRKPGGIKKRNELCKRFTTTGSCYKGPSCLYIHDPDKVAICKEFLQTGKCSAGLSCDLSHEPSPHRSPVCLHFLRGRCTNPECRYSHVRVTPGAPVCRDFATLGYCEKGAECEQRHVHECPDYANTGACHKKRCLLPHVDRAGQIRKMAAQKAEVEADAAEAVGATADAADISSEEEDYDQIDSDDVDSDDLEEDDSEEIITGVDTGEVSQQQDFVHF